MNEISVRTRATFGFTEFVMFAAAGVAVGVAISLLAFLSARYGPVGPGWSFRGNGALAVYTAIPAAVAAGWTALAWRWRGYPNAARTGLAAGVVGLILAMLDVLLLPTFGPAGDRAIGPFVLLLLAAWMIVAPTLAAFLPTGQIVAERISPLAAIGGAIIWVVAVAAGLIAAGVAVPPGS